MLKTKVVAITKDLSGYRHHDPTPEDVGTYVAVVGMETLLGCEHPSPCFKDDGRCRCCEVSKEYRSGRHVRMIISCLRRDGTPVELAETEIDCSNSSLSLSSQPIFLLEENPLDFFRDSK